MVIVYMYVCSTINMSIVLVNTSLITLVVVVKIIPTKYSSTSSMVTIFTYKSTATPSPFLVVSITIIDVSFNEKYGKGIRIGHLLYDTHVQAEEGSDLNTIHIWSI